jgi:hypothetical protein
VSYQQARQHRGAKIALLASVTADNGVPTDIVAATGTLTLTGIPVEDETVTIDTTVYRWRDTLALPNDVKIGVSAAACVTNLVAAVLATAASEGTLFGTGTVAHTTVTAADGAGDTVVVTAITAGTGGNSIATTEASTNMSWGAGTMSGGVARETDAIEIAADNRGQIRTYELTLVGSVSSGTISYDAYLWADDSPTDLTADLGKFSRLGIGQDPGHVNTGEPVVNLVFRAVVDNLGNSHYPYLEIKNLTGTGAAVEAYLREIVERNA